ncbi:MAG: formylglycine-generating enzyme family protein [Coleofasciculaceae cyanobacterium SM2_1_6]|nr:formylglycine-generating enzyme family protein [Coleofasciculaceae cyanobacterium SM2_1_6]
MVDIPAGQFWMGSPAGKGEDDEKPYHLVTLKGFRMGKYPITQAQWSTIALSPEINRPLYSYPSRFQGDSLPVEQVSWYEAEEFCARLSDLTGDTYYLPSEAEWEYACRAGAKKYTEYCFGDSKSKLKDYAWFGDNSRNTTHPVGEKLPNAFGLYDMHGNIWEWCADDWHKNHEKAPADGTAWTNNDNCSQADYLTKVLRGGSWYNVARNCRSGNRVRGNAGYHDFNYGFRVACISFLPRTL